jgi:hypothetical protein
MAPQESELQQIIRQKRDLDELYPFGDQAWKASIALGKMSNREISPQSRLEAGSICFRIIQSAIQGRNETSRQSEHAQQLIGHFDLFLRTLGSEFRTHIQSLRESYRSRGHSSAEPPLHLLEKWEAALIPYSQNPGSAEPRLPLSSFPNFGLDVIRQTLLRIMEKKKEVREQITGIVRSDFLTPHEDDMTKRAAESMMEDFQQGMSTEALHSLGKILSEDALRKAVLSDINKVYELQFPASKNPVPPSILLQDEEAKASTLLGQLGGQIEKLESLFKSSTKKQPKEGGGSEKSSKHEKSEKSEAYEQEKEIGESAKRYFARFEEKIKIPTLNLTSFSAKEFAKWIDRSGEYHWRNRDGEECTMPNLIAEFELERDDFLQELRAKHPRLLKKFAWIERFDIHDFLEKQSRTFAGQPEILKNIVLRGAPRIRHTTRGEGAKAWWNSSETDGDHARFFEYYGEIGLTKKANEDTLTHELLHHFPQGEYSEDLPTLLEGMTEFLNQCQNFTGAKMELAYPQLCVFAGLLFLIAPERMKATYGKSANEKVAEELLRELVQKTGISLTVFKKVLEAEISVQDFLETLTKTAGEGFDFNAAMLDTVEIDPRQQLMLAGFLTSYGLLTPATAQTILERFSGRVVDMTDPTIKNLLSQFLKIVRNPGLEKKKYALLNGLRSIFGELEFLTPYIKLASLPLAPLVGLVGKILGSSGSGMGSFLGKHGKEKGEIGMAPDEQTKVLKQAFNQLKELKKKLMIQKRLILQEMKNELREIQLHHSSQLDGVKVTAHDSPALARFDYALALAKVPDAPTEYLESDNPDRQKIEELADSEHFIDREAYKGSGDFIGYSKASDFFTERLVSLRKRWAETRMIMRERQQKFREQEEVLSEQRLSTAEYLEDGFRGEVEERGNHLWCLYKRAGKFQLSDAAHGDLDLSDCSEMDEAKFIKNANQLGLVFSKAGKCFYKNLLTPQLALRELPINSVHFITADEGSDYCTFSKSGDLFLFKTTDPTSPFITIPLEIHNGATQFSCFINERHAIIDVLRMNDHLKIHHDIKTGLYERIGQYVEQKDGTLWILAEDRVTKYPANGESERITIDLPEDAKKDGLLVAEDQVYIKYHQYDFETRPVRVPPLKKQYLKNMRNQQTLSVPDNATIDQGFLRYNSVGKSHFIDLRDPDHQPEILKEGVNNLQLFLVSKFLVFRKNNSIYTQDLREPGKEPKLLMREGKAVVYDHQQLNDYLPHVLRSDTGTYLGVLEENTRLTYHDLNRPDLPPYRPPEEVKRVMTVSDLKIIEVEERKWIYQAAKEKQKNGFLAELTIDGSGEFYPISGDLFQTSQGPSFIILPGEAYGGLWCVLNLNHPEQLPLFGYDHMESLWLESLQGEFPRFGIDTTGRHWACTKVQDRNLQNEKQVLELNIFTQQKQENHRFGDIWQPLSAELKEVDGKMVFCAYGLVGENGGIKNMVKVISDTNPTDREYEKQVELESHAGDYEDIISRHLDRLKAYRVAESVPGTITSRFEFDSEKAIRDIGSNLDRFIGRTGLAIQSHIERIDGSKLPHRTSNQSGEFFSFRPYQPGDDYHRTKEKMGQLMTKESEKTGTKSSELIIEMSDYLSDPEAFALKLTKLLSLMHNKSQEGNVRISNIVVTYFGEVVPSPVRTPTLENSNPVKNSRELVEYLAFICKGEAFEKLIEIPEQARWRYVIHGITMDISEQVNEGVRIAEEAYYQAFPQKRLSQEKPQRKSENGEQFGFNAEQIKQHIRSSKEDVIVIGASEGQLHELRDMMGRKWIRSIS